MYLSFLNTREQHSDTNVYHDIYVYILEKFKNDTKINRLSFYQGELKKEVLFTKRFIYFPKKSQLNTEIWRERDLSAAVSIPR